mmetsp:Transcript_10841/g.38310  ORF Transcript_10841/g.38310 Transcript_10841/m.38310 type:complete len:248 (+) Transcript_10841:1107-1850(+)
MSARRGGVSLLRGRRRISRRRAPERCARISRRLRRIRASPRRAARFASSASLSRGGSARRIGWPPARKHPCPKKPAAPCASPPPKCANRAAIQTTRTTRRHRRYRAAGRRRATSLGPSRRGRRATLGTRRSCHRGRPPTSRRSARPQRGPQRGPATRTTAGTRARRPARCTSRAAPNRASPTSAAPTTTGAAPIRRQSGGWAGVRICRRRGARLWASGRHPTRRGRLRASKACPPLPASWPPGSACP